MTTRRSARGVALGACTALLLSASSAYAEVIPDVGYPYNTPSCQQAESNWITAQIEWSVFDGWAPAIFDAGTAGAEQQFEDQCGYDP